MDIMIYMAKEIENSGGNESQRHTVYPYYSLDRAIKVAEVVKDLGGTNADVSKSQIAHGLQVGEASSSLPALLGAARIYLLLEGRGSYRLTEIAKQYFYPANPEEKRLALLNMVKGPPLYSALIDRFDGTKFPATENLVNILHREQGVAETWQARVASMFISSLRDAQVIDTAGFVRFKAMLHTTRPAVVPTTQLAATEPMLEAVPTPPAQVQSVVAQQPGLTPVARAGVTLWAYHGIRLEVPEQMTMSLWQKLANYVNVLKPEEEG